MGISGMIKFISITMLIGVMIFLVANAWTNIDDKEKFTQRFIENPVNSSKAMIKFAVGMEALTPTIYQKDWLPPKKEQWINGEKTATKYTYLIEDFPMIDSKFDVIPMILINLLIVFLLKSTGLFDDLHLKKVLYIIIGFIILNLILLILLKIFWLNVYISGCTGLGETVDNCMIIRQAQIDDITDKGLYMTSVIITIVTSLIFIFAFTRRKDA